MCTPAAPIGRGYSRKSSSARYRPGKRIDRLNTRGRERPTRMRRKDVYAHREKHRNTSIAFFNFIPTIRF
jgi:hypothetical protein